MSVRSHHLADFETSKRFQISDFGLSKIAEELDTTKKKEEGSEPPIEHIPIRWMAPETLRRPQLWSAKSDVWSFGVLLYEMFNNGEKPWPDDEPKRIATHIRFVVIKRENACYAGRHTASDSAAYNEYMADESDSLRSIATSKTGEHASQKSTQQRANVCKA
ncbi:hypothetical protein TELCIR_04820 [Teladorsagia circumcincta]|uniref:Protein kinase domain-containing protein n=1 Tax=Teladorsagia circumcincta TaxID=45464 RepID=A0A2G9USU9_TELCI|nr:hypothetical protein TELCIR_04820 [Teladorsagia circumcincta]